MKRKLRRLWLLTKRLYKKPAFLALLVLIPLLTAGYTAAAQEESGVLTVALAVRDQDALAEQIVTRLTAEDSLLRFVRCQTPEEAENMVRWGKADSAWIFREQLSVQMGEFLQDPKNALTDVVQREETVLLRLTREKLSGTLFGLLAEEKYLQYARENALEQLSKEELLAQFEAAAPEGDLFAFAQKEAAAPVTYLTAPVRGLLAILMALCALASAMYFMDDLSRGTFGWVAHGKLGAVELGCQLIGIGNVAVAVALSLLLCGLLGDPLRELAALGLYALCCAVFAMALGRICAKQNTLAVTLSVLCVAMAGICPVFFDLGILRPVQLLLPPTYYIRSLQDLRYLGYMAAYTLLWGLVAFVAGKLRRR